MLDLCKALAGSASALFILRGYCVTVRHTKHIRACIINLVVERGDEYG